MNNINNSIYLRRQRAFFVEPVIVKEGYNLDNYIATFAMNISQMGFVFSSEAISYLRDNLNSKEHFVKFANEFLADIRLLKKAHVQYKPFYPNFPSQVADASDTELIINAIMHYSGSAHGLDIRPNYEENARDILFDFKDLEVIQLGSIESYNKIVTSLLSSKLALSESDKKDVRWFFTNVEDVADLLPSSIPNKENLTFALGLASELAPSIMADLLSRASNATDLLRSAVALSGNEDTSLVRATRFVSFKRSVRKGFLKALNGMPSATEDMLRYPEEWKRLGERLHPSEFADRFPNAHSSFEVIRNNLPYKTFTSELEDAISARDIQTTISLLSTRPGEYARRVDELLRKFSTAKEREAVCNGFDLLAAKVSTNVLWQLYSHLGARITKNSLRSFTPKDSVANIFTIPDRREALNLDDVSRLVTSIEKALVSIYSLKPNLGKVYVDPALTQFAIPSSIRNASRSLNSLGRGSRLNLKSTSIENDDVLRMFVWWKEEQSRVDLDLSVGLLDDQANLVHSVSYTNLRYKGHILHSGDITTAPKGASEFVDIKMADLRNDGIRYVVMSVYSFTHTPFFELPECFAGYMLRKANATGHAQVGKVFDARTVEQAFDLTSDTKISVPMILDLEKEQVIWADLSLVQDMQSLANIHENSSKLSELVKAVTETEKATLYDLLTLHAISRGTQVDSKEEADTIFSAEGFRPSVSQEEILSEYI